MEFIDCGADNEFVALEQARQNMQAKWKETKPGSQIYEDFHTAYQMNLDKSRAFQKTDIYQAWYAANGYNGVIQALAKHYCGEEITGRGSLVPYSEKDFKTHYCPSKLSSENHFASESWLMI